MNLIEGLQHEANRRRETLKQYEEIGPAGAIGAMLLRRDIHKCEAAIGNGDLVEMMRLYATLNREELK